MPHYKRLRRFENPQEARFLTFSCYQRLPLFSNDRIKALFVEQLDRTRLRLRATLHGWVIMPDHVHLLITPALPESTIPQFLMALKRPFATRVLARWRDLRAPIVSRLIDNTSQMRFWQQGGGYDRNIHSDEEYEEKLEYIHANPVKRGLAKTPLDWPWSSAQWYAGHKDALIDLS